MTDAQVHALARAKPFKINEDVILAHLKRLDANGATQQEVFKSIITGQDLTPEQTGAIYQQVSRELSTMAKDGILDDSMQVLANSGGRTVYRIPASKLTARKTKMEVLREENEALKEQIANMTERIDFLVMMREKDAEKIKKLEER